MCFLKPLFLVLFLSLISFQSSYSQMNCAADPVHQYLLENDEVYRAEREAVESKIQQFKANATERRSTYTIPVVVHIMHLGEIIGVGTNISEAKVIEAINGANTRWNDMNGPGPNMDVEFCLAKIDPNGNPTSGINRVNASGVTDYLINGLILNYEDNSNEIELKNLSNWPHNQYYNIWVVTKFNAGWGGFAYYPSVSNFDIDGAAIISTSMHGNTSLVSHELGHGLGLYHTFEGDNGATCPSNTDCTTQGDRVCDTPPHTQSQCSSTNCSVEGDLDRIFDNYMSYCSGLNRFTQGQKDRVDAALLNTARNDLITAGTCYFSCEDVEVTINGSTCDPSAVGTVIDTFVAFNTCDSIVTTITSLIPAATADFNFSISGLQVSFTNNVSNAESFEWNFGDGTNQNGGNNVNHTYVNPDVYEVSLIASNVCGSDTAKKIVDLSVSSISLADQFELVQISPNPNNGNFTLQLNGASLKEALQIVVVDLGGKIIEERSMQFIGNEMISYQLKNLNSGIYFLKIQSGKTQPFTLPFEVIR